MPSWTNDTMRRLVINMHDIISPSHWAPHGAIAAHANGSVQLRRAVEKVQKYIEITQQHELESRPLD